MHEKTSRRAERNERKEAGRERITREKGSGGRVVFCGFVDKTKARLRAVGAVHA